MASSSGPHIFSPEYYERLERFEQDHPWSLHMQRLAFALLGRYGGGNLRRVLDAGCGAGYFTRLWQTQSGAAVFGIDSSLDGLRLARERGLRGLAAGSVAAIPFRTGSFDAVYCADVIQHLDTAAAASTLAEFARVLRSGGLLLIRAAARRGLASKRHLDTPDYQQWEPEKLRAHLAPCGLVVEWMSLVNWLPSLAADLAAARRPTPAGDVGLPAAPVVPTGLTRAVLTAYWSLEAACLLRCGCRLPGGHTLLCLARKS
jgi:SAM-dependent methyltransferase